MVLESGTKNCLVPPAHLFPGAIKCNALTGAPTEAEHGTRNLSPAQAPLTIWSRALSINQHTAGSYPKEPTEQCVSLEGSRFSLLWITKGYLEKTQQTVGSSK